MLGDLSRLRFLLLQRQLASVGDALAEIYSEHGEKSSDRTERNRETMKNSPPSNFPRPTGLADRRLQPCYRWNLLLSTIIQSDALRKNHTSGIAHLAGSTRDVGSADHSESVARGVRKCRLDWAWLFLNMLLSR